MKTERPIVADVIPASRSWAATQAHLAAVPMQQKRPGKAPPVPPLAPQPRGAPPSRVPLARGFLPPRSVSLDRWFHEGKDKKRAPAAAPPSPVLPLKLSHSHSVKKFSTILVLLIVGVLIAGYGLGRVLATVHITLTPRSAVHAVDREVTISRNPLASQVPGELVLLTNTDTQEFSSTGSEQIEQKASGTIVIYNAFDSAPQVLVATTRFEAPDGRIYRIAKSVKIPGATIQEGKLVPSSLEVTVYADEAGETYNSGLTDFTIPGFEGSSKFEGFYARSKTPMAGGFVGTAVVVADSDLAAAEESLGGTLTEVTRMELTEKVPPEFTLLDNGYEVTTDELTFSAEAGEKADTFSGEITVSARGLIFRMDDVARALADSLGLDEGVIHLMRVEGLQISVVSRSLDEGRMRVRITGDAAFVWDVDESSLKNEIIRTVTEPDGFEQVFFAYDAVEGATVRFSPRWVRTIPAREEDIVIEYADLTF